VIKAKAAIKAATGARANGFEPTREKAEVLNEPGMKWLPTIWQQPIKHGNRSRSEPVECFFGQF
jgi:hypothetical protein